MVQEPVWVGMTALPRAREIENERERELEGLRPCPRAAPSTAVPPDKKNAPLGCRVSPCDQASF